MIGYTFEVILIWNIKKATKSDTKVWKIGGKINRLSQLLTFNTSSPSVQKVSSDYPYLLYILMYILYILFPLYLLYILLYILYILYLLYLINTSIRLANLLHAEREARSVLQVSGRLPVFTIFTIYTYVYTVFMYLLYLRM